MMHDFEKSPWQIKGVVLLFAWAVVGILLPHCLIPLFGGGIYKTREIWAQADLIGISVGAIGISAIVLGTIAQYIFGSRTR